MVKLRSDYKAPSCVVEEAFLNIDIHEDHTVVTTRLALRRVDDAPFMLNGRDLDLQAFRLDGVDLAKDKWPLTDGGLLLQDLPPEATVETVSICHPESNTALEGLYLSGGMYCTQCEPEGFRRIGYFPDRPDVMTCFTVRIEASRAFPQLLSNGNLIETGDAGDDRHYALWHDPHPKPSYLFACVVGDLDCAADSFTTRSGRNVDLHIYVEKGNLDLTGHAMESLKKSMLWDEERFGLEYDLDLFQIVAVSHFNMGAMENKGLNIFNSKYVLADKSTATDADLHNVESIIAHEYFHNWTGNRVTCRDWFQLTLKEGLTVFRDQCFSADMHDAGVQRAQDVSMLRAAQFPEDRSPTAHPIRPESYREINNFYTATVYEKGAEVIRMLSGYLGTDGFRRGMDLYFSRHDGQAVTCDDFVAALADANEIDLSAFSGWYSQAGTPRLQVRRDVSSADASITLTFTQTIPETAANTPREPLPIPVRLGFLQADGAPAMLRRDGENDARADHVLLIEKAHEVVIFHIDASSGGAVDELTPSLLRGFSAPVILDDDLTVAERLHLMAHDEDLFNRWDAAQSLLADAVIAYSRGQGDCDQLARCYRQILADDNLLDQFKASILGIPGIAVLESRIKPADPVALHEARLALQAALGQALCDEVDACLANQATHAETAGGRALLNQLLALGVAAGNAAAVQMAGAQVLDANMTLSQGALRALMDSDSPERVSGLKAFHDRWQNAPLVMEKWFQMEAMSSVGGTLERLEELMQHKAFDPNNPNKIRSVLGAFMAGNPARFYAADGSGFDFIARHLIDIDKRNPQVAARMALPLTRMAAYADGRKAQMVSALQQIQSSKPSNDLGEVVDKALAASA